MKKQAREQPGKPPGRPRCSETDERILQATLRRLAEEGVVRPDERVVVYVTGHGLKTLDAVGPATPTATIAPTVDAFRAAFPGAAEA